MEISIPISKNQSNTLLIIENSLHPYLIGKYQFIEGGLSQNNILYTIRDKQSNIKFIITIIQTTNNKILINIRSLLKTQTEQYTKTILNEIKEFIENLI